MFFHHIFSLSQTLPALIVIDNKIGLPNMNQVFSTESSSIFLAINYFSKKYNWPKQVYTISNVCFLVSFLYYRIYNYYINIMLNENYLDCVIQMDPLYVSITKFIMNIGVYGLFGLNLYWLTIVIKMLYKSTLKHLTVRHAEYLLQYSYLLCLITTIVGYTVYTTPEQKEIYGHYFLYDICANGLLYCTSYKFHNYIYTNLNTSNDLNKATNHYRNYLLQDIIILQGRALTQFYVHINMHSLFESYKFLFYFQVCYSIVLCSIVSLVYSVLIYNNIQYSLNNTSIYNNCLDVLLGSNAFLCIFYSAFGVWNTPVGTHLLTTLYVLSLIMFMKPFYDMNHLMIHVGMIPINYFMVLANVPTS